jgi:hypothetical protein
VGRRCRQLLYVLNAIFLFQLFSAQLTGDLIQNRTYWGAFGLAWLIVSWKRRT